MPKRSPRKSSRHRRSKQSKRGSRHRKSRPIISKKEQDKIYKQKLRAGKLKQWEIKVKDMTPEQQKEHRKWLKS